ncbi:hypothetical protein BASA60_004024 [Batrachochytrium salamandrivorans]|nr:hypothetical protein BASA60_004024 [Batrachochytrium salamandrivorans]
MEYPGKGWMALDRYMTEQGKLSVVEVRFIAREVLKALLSLKSSRCCAWDIAEWNEDSSAKKPSDEKPDFWSTEKPDLVGVGKLMYHLLTLEDANQYPGIRGRVANKLERSLGNLKSQLAMDVMDLVHILLGQGPYEMTLEDALQHPFFSRQ